MLAGWAAAHHRHSGGQDRRGRDHLWRRPVAALAGPGPGRQPTGGNVFRAVGLLPAATGNLAKPGAGFLYLNGGARRGIDSDYLEAPQLRSGRAAQGQPHGSGGDTERSPGRRRRSSPGTSTSPPPIPTKRGCIACCATNGCSTSRSIPFPTDTTDFADYVLPAASFLEFDDIVSPSFHLFDVGAGESAGTHGRRAAEPGDLPPPGACDGIQRG